MKRLSCLLLIIMLLFSVARAERLTDDQLISYYDDALFIGDSQIRMLRNYVTSLQQENPDFFRGAHFYSAYNYQMGTAAMDQVISSRVNLTYKGVERTMYYIASKYAPPKLFFLAGMNDRIAFHVDRGMKYVDRIMENMRKTVPETQMYFFSLPPITQKFEKKEHAREKMDAYNEMLAAKCQETGAIYIDIASDLKGEDGLMLPGISSDGETHLNEQGYAIWIQTMLDFAQEQYEAGSWTPSDGAR